MTELERQRDSNDTANGEFRVPLSQVGREIDGAWTSVNMGHGGRAEASRPRPLVLRFAEPSMQSATRRRSNSSGTGSLAIPS